MKLKKSLYEWPRNHIKMFVMILLLVIVVTSLIIYIKQITTQSKTNSNTITETLDTNINRNNLNPTIYDIPKNPSNRALNIVFISENIHDKSKFATQTEWAKTAIKAVEPFKSHQFINFFSVYTGKDTEMCELHNKDSEAPSLKCTTKVNDYILPLGLIKFKAIILSEQYFITWSNVTRLENSLVAYSTEMQRINSEFATRLLQSHFAHGFGLKDEMVKSIIADDKSKAKLPDGPNCVPDAKLAIGMWGDKVTKVANQYIYGDPGDVGFYKGCAGNENYIKPVKFSLMNLERTGEGSDRYGKVSEQYLKQVLKYCYSPNIFRLNEIANQDDINFFEWYPEYRSCVK
jgi:hypothetical protein